MISHDCRLEYCPRLVDFGSYANPITGWMFPVTIYAQPGHVFLVPYEIQALDLQTRMGSLSGWRVAA